MNVGLHSWTNLGTRPTAQTCTPLKTCNMKKHLFILLGLICTTAVMAQNTQTTKTKHTSNKSEVKTAALSPEEAEKKWMEYMTPGEMHKWLSTQDGEWTSEVTMWMDPAAPPVKSTATSYNKMILGGRYQESSFKGDMMGMPFEGRGIFGYDNAKKLFVSSWVDNMGTGIIYMEGGWDEKTKSINLKGKCIDPLTGKEMKMREVITFIDENTQKMEMFDYKDGKETKTMEIISRRKI